ncbi:hypothetical protein CEJ78_19805, partial [Acinetobacter baumannii]
MWTCEVVYEICLLKWGQNVQNLMFLRAECLWLLWLFLWGTLKSAKLSVLYRYGACPRQGVTWRDGIPAIPIIWADLAQEVRSGCLAVGGLPVQTPAWACR